MQYKKRITGDPSRPLFCHTGIYEKSPKLLNFRDLLAVRTGLEPATSGVTGRHSNQAELPHRFSLCPLHFRKGLQRYSVFTYLQIFLKKFKEIYNAAIAFS